VRYCDQLIEEREKEKEKESERRSAWALRKRNVKKAKRKRSLANPSSWPCRCFRDRLEGVLLVSLVVCELYSVLPAPHFSPFPLSSSPRVYIRSAVFFSVWHVCVRFARPVDKCLSAMPAVRKYRRDTSEVSCCLKYVIFGFNVMFWVSTARGENRRSDVARWVESREISDVTFEVVRTLP